MLQKPVMPKESTCSSLHNYLWSITTGKLCKVILVVIFPLTNLINSSSLQDGKTQMNENLNNYCYTKALAPHTSEHIPRISSKTVDMLTDVETNASINFLVNDQKWL